MKNKNEPLTRLIYEIRKTGKKYFSLSEALCYFPEKLNF